MSQKKSSFNPFAILGISPTLIWKTIKTAANRLIKSLHPDQNSTIQDAGTRLEAVKKARDELKDDRKREAYYKRFARSPTNKPPPQRTSVPKTTQNTDSFEKLRERLRKEKMAKNQPKAKITNKQSKTALTKTQETASPKASFKKAQTTTSPEGDQIITHENSARTAYSAAKKVIDSQQDDGPTIDERF